MSRLASDLPVSRPPLPRWKKFLFGGLMTGLCLGLLEVSLRWLGGSSTAADPDRWVGFTGQSPLLEVAVEEDGQERLRTAPNKLTWFNELDFPQRKPPRGFRIVCLGGSTTYGHPFWDITSYSRWMRELLPLVDDVPAWEVINAGGISYASYRVVKVMEEFTRYQPDLFVVFSAHNEFLERRTYASMFERSSLQIELSAWLSRTRTWQAMSRWLRPEAKGDAPPAAGVELLPAEVDEMLNHSIGPIDYHRNATWQAGVLQHYEANLRRMVAIARKAGAAIVLVVPASNNRDCSPFKSEIDPRLGQADREKIEGLLASAASPSSKPSVDDTQRWEEVLALDPGYAEASYRLGKAAVEEGQYELAANYFRDARNHDVCPLRAPDAITAIMRRVASEEKVPLVDFEAKLTQHCRAQFGHELLGDDYFLDHVHPTIEIHRQLAHWILEGMLEAGLITGAPVDQAANAARLEAIRRQVEAEIDAPTQGIAFRNLAKTWHWAGRYEEAEPAARDALEFLPGDKESRFVLADSLKNQGRSSESLLEYEKLFEDHPAYERAFQPFGELLAAQRQWGRAKAYLMLAHVKDPENASILYWLGLSHLELREYDLAVEALRRVLELYPADPPTQFVLAQALIGNRQFEEAQRLLEGLLAAGENPEIVQAELESLREQQSGKP
jgi:tetratricopeptide (TPR) repeat protein